MFEGYHSRRRIRHEALSSDHGYDEIQRYKEIVTKIKFLVDNKRFRYIMSGSLTSLSFKGWSG